MPLRLFALLLVCVANQAIGQFRKAGPPAETRQVRDIPCDCEVLRSSVRGYFPSEEAAGRVVAELMKLVRQHSSLTYIDTIVVKEAGCGAPESRNCRTQLPNKRVVDVPLILYNNLFLNGISREEGAVTRIDRHTLAHEIGHHVLGHLKHVNNDALFSRLHGTDATNRDRIARRYSVSNLQAEEIQADFFGLWLLRLTEKSLDFKDFASAFNTEYIQKTVEKGMSHNPSHPLFKDRIQAMRRFWEQLQHLQAQRVGVSRGYFSNAASAAYIELHPERPFWDLGFVGGLTVAGKPVFSAGGQPVDGLLYAAPDAYNLYVGLTVSRFNWFSPWRYEAELAYSTQKYGTTIGSGSTRQLTESLDLRALTLFPKITWSPVGNQDNLFVSNRFGVFVSAGPMVRWPLGLTYQNYATNVAPANVPSLQATVNPRVSVGVELMKKTFLPRAYKLAISYEPTWIRLNTTPPPKALSHNIDLTLYYSFVRW